MQDYFLIKDRGEKQLKRKHLMIIGFILFSLGFAAGLLFYIKISDWNKKEISESQIVETKELTGVDEQEEENGNSENDSREEANDSESVEEEIQIEEKEKIELMDYAELSVEEFMEETGIRLLQDKERGNNIWATEDDVIWLRVDNGKIVMLGIDRLLCDERAGELIEKEGLPYTLAGISLGDDIDHIEGTILKDACHRDGMLNEEFYGSLYLSKFGIEVLHLWHDAGEIDVLSVEIDKTLKENAEDLEYIWEERVCQKEGSRNDRLKNSQEPYTEFPERYREKENIDETFVWTRYPYLAIPGKPEMEKNANEVIAEAVEKMWKNTYGSTDENILVDAEYNISYVTSKFISIVFYVRIKDSSGWKNLWQYCNINIGENGRKAYLSDLGISKERVAARCEAGHELGPVDTESFLENYDTNWDRYFITPTEYGIIVKPLYEEEENWQFGERTCTLRLTKLSGNRP